MRHTGWLAALALGWASLMVTSAATGEGNGGSAPAHDVAATAPGPPPDRGAEVYAFSCAVCHGATGQGFAEAVLAFPEDYRDCAVCHQPQNAAVMPGSQVGMAVMAFSLGEPPGLDYQRLARFGTVGGLYRYVASAMPRWAPGSLEDDAYLAVTAHLLRTVGALAAGETLTAAALDSSLTPR